MRTALVTGGSAGLGNALIHRLVDDGWLVITNARDGERLATSLADLPATQITAIAGDLTDADHRAALVTAVAATGGSLDLLVHNASTLGPASGTTRRRLLADVTPEDLQHVWRHNVGAPLILTAGLLPSLRTADGVLLAITSDAAVEHYEGWGLYSASKAALEHITLTYGAENNITAYAVDPGDMRTAMHQEWFPDEDISDRPLPETVVPHLVALLDERPPSGRYVAADIPVRPVRAAV